MGFRDLLILIKVRITALVTLTALAGYGLAPNPQGGWPLIEVAVGVFLITAGASIVNMFLERRTDALMNRTRLRPLPLKILTPAAALTLGLAISLAGLWPLLSADRLPAGIAALAWFLYVVVYTPLKSMTSLNTIVGAIPGALPPLIGWTATGAPLSMAAFIPFLLMFAWQIPHFLALAWMYRDDYGRAGFPMLPVTDPGGRSAGRQALLYACALLPASLVPAALGVSGTIYFWVALVLGVVMVALSWRFATSRNERSAYALFIGSIVYLPLIWVAMILNH